MSTNRLSGAVPSSRWTSAVPTFGPPNANSWSNSDWLSRIEPLARRATKSMAAGSTSTPSARAISDRRSRMRWVSMVPKSNRWHRERMVSGSFWGSVVAKMNLTLGGGSSRVFNRALKASLVSMCTSSMM